MTTNENHSHSLGCPICRSTELRSGGVRYDFHPSAIAPDGIGVRQTGEHRYCAPWRTVECSFEHKFERTDLVFADGPYVGLRPLLVIAADVSARWPNVWYGAVPYLEAMGWLITVDDSFGHDDGRSIVRYFLSNARYWQGPDARRIKIELQRHVKR